LSVKTVKVNPGDDGADSQVNLLERKAPRSSISHEQGCTAYFSDYAPQQILEINPFLL
jgi:hypothetical protein